ncbi:MAG: class I SAM-dependent methyltransferase [Gemmatimonadaceae bacterium]
MSYEFTTLQAARRARPLDASAASSAMLDPSMLRGDALTERSRRIWSAGEYDRISAGFRHEADAFVGRLSLASDLDVLDAACGSGNLTIPAARLGARVTALDLVSSLLALTDAWAMREGLSIRLDQGTVEDLPYADARFDVVMSMFGVMFAARPDRVVSELARVTRRGGRIALANWTRRGFVGEMLAMHGKYLSPPAEIPSPLLWGDESCIRERFDERAWKVETNLRTLTFRYPHTPGGTAKLFRTAYGPTVQTLEMLDNESRGMLASDLADLWADHQRIGAAGTVVDSEYLEVIAVRR